MYCRPRAGFTAAPGCGPTICGSVELVGGGVAFALPDFAAVAVGDVLNDPAGYVLGRGIEREDVVEDAVVHGVEDEFLDLGKVYDHAAGVELLGSALHGDDPVVAV